MQLHIKRLTIKSPGSTRTIKKSPEQRVIRNSSQSTKDDKVIKNTPTAGKSASIEGKLIQ